MSIFHHHFMLYSASHRVYKHLLVLKKNKSFTELSGGKFP